MKSSRVRWLFIVTAIALGTGGVVASNVGCGGGDDNGGADGGGGTGGSGATITDLYTFDTSDEGWVLSDYADTNYTNLGAVSNPDSGVSLDGGVAPMLAWAGDVGSPDNGALRLSVTFSGFKQYVDPKVNIGTPVDLSNQTLRIKVRLASGTFPAGGVQFHVSSGLTPPNNYVYVSAPFVGAASLVAGQWVTVSLDTTIAANTDNPPRVFDASQIVEIGVQFTTGDPYEGGTLTFGPAVFEIDTVDSVDP